MKRIEITSGETRAVILPDFGGMVSELSICGTDVLRMNYGMLGMSSVLAGGIPVLFPFLSRSRNDEATFEGDVYTMPMHGFAKDVPFEVLSQWEQGCELRIVSNEMTRRFYPYDFQFCIRYELDGNCLNTTAIISNLSDRALPFVLGFHPYFLTQDRSKTEFRFGLRRYWDYTRMDAEGNPFEGMLDAPLTLNASHDTVFWEGDPQCEIVNTELGYRARLRADDTFGVVTICTMLENASCVEPWQARPGAAADRSMCQVAQRGEKKVYHYQIALQKL